jgi:redox-sensitive bicupin YhaK (pirin superfamily)
MAGMITLRPARERGHADHGWLDTWHSFSFADYHDPLHMGFRALRVINEDRIQPGQGFGTHGHRDMEIVTWILAGELAHRDSLGSGASLRPGDVQAMSAGRGIEHSEFNPSPDQPLHLLQIWLLPRARGGEPRWEQRHVPAAERAGRFAPLASDGGRRGGLPIRCDATVYAGSIAAGAAMAHDLAPGRHAWLQVARGTLTAGGVNLGAGDGLAVSGVPRLELTAHADAEVLLFDLA